MSLILRAYGGQIFNAVGATSQSPSSLQCKNFWRCFSRGQLSGEQSRFQNRRTRGGNKDRTSKVMYVLDKFIKHASYDGSLIIRAPFNIQVSYYTITQKNRLKS